MSTFPLAFKRTRASSSKAREKILKKRLAETLQSSSIVVVPSPSIGGGDETLSIDQDEEENLTIVDDLAFEDNNFLVDDGLFDEGEETVEIFESITSSANEDGENDSEDDQGHDDYSQESLKHSFRIPNNPFSAIEKYSILFEEVCDNFNFSREGCKCVLALHISRKSTKHLIPYLLLSFIALDRNSKLLSKDVCNKLVKKVIPLKMTRTYDMCRASCYLFDSKHDANLQECPVCKARRRGCKLLKMVSIADKIAEM
ncbi:hypothetical protein, partial, partial [Parasitella parasitica]